MSIVQGVDGSGGRRFYSGDGSGGVIVHWFRMGQDVQTARLLSSYRRTVTDVPARVFPEVVLVVVPVVSGSSGGSSSAGGSQWSVVPVMVLCCRLSYPLLQL